MAFQIWKTRLFLKWMIFILLLNKKYDPGCTDIYQKWKLEFCSMRKTNHLMKERRLWSWRDKFHGELPSTSFIMLCSECNGLSGAICNNASRSIGYWGCRMAAITGTNSLVRYHFSSHCNAFQDWVSHSSQAHSSLEDIVPAEYNVYLQAQNLKLNTLKLGMDE